MSRSTATATSIPSRCPRHAMTARPGPHGIRRWVLATLGLASVAVGGVGVIVPGLPTTIFLLFASWCFVRSCPWLEDRVIRNRFFGPYLRYLDGDAAMPMRTRVTAIAAMWTCITVSTILLMAGERVAPWIIAILPLAGVIGTVVIMRWRREPKE